MALYAIGDTHLSLGTSKPMDVFGGRWENYVEKLRDGLSVLEDGDVCVICGDISWGMSMEEAKPDFEFLDSFPGTKIVLKGNHDYWWSTANKANVFFEQNGIKSIRILHNNFHPFGDFALCGTRGWFYEEETHNGEHDRKIMNRELMRLEASLKAAGEREKLAFLHYPPIYNTYVCREILELFNKYNVKKCFYGHIHGAGQRFAFEGWRGTVEYRLVAADHIDFRPIKICD